MEWVSHDFDHFINQRESFWIHQLDALRFPGLNEDIEFKCFFMMPLSCTRFVMFCI